MAQQLTAEQLQATIAQTFSADETIRRNAETRLAQAQRSPGHALQVLRLVENANAEIAVRQGAAVHFKNLVKNGWNENEEEDRTNEIVISGEHRALIKQHVVELMCTAPPQIKDQLSESISLIAKSDFPQKWDELLPELVERFNSPDPAVVDGVLQTANSIFKRFRYVQRDDALYADIIYVLERIQAPLLTLFVSMGRAVEAYRNDPGQLIPRLSSLRYICRIFYSLNYQDLPEYFEDHMQEWMDGFTNYLQYHNPLLVDNDEEDEPSPIDTLQAAIVENLKLYVDKDEEPFLPHLRRFITLVWNLLRNDTVLPKHDTLATTSMRFLSALVQKQMYINLFSDEALKQMIADIVVPNLMIREIDQERFVDDPQEFIRTDIEGSDSDSRRKCSQELLRAMCRQFEEQTTAICSEHVGRLLNEYAGDPNRWIAKDAAIQIMMGIAIRRETPAHGVSEVNERVNVMEFFDTHIFPEIRDPNHSVPPMVKAAAMKFVSTFRNQFSRAQLVSLMPLLIAHLASPTVVVHTYASFAIERILTTKETDPHGVQRNKLTSTDLEPSLEQLFTSLFRIIDNVQWTENEYAMKCVMRSLSVANARNISVAQMVPDRIAGALGRAARNPGNPRYNHYLFESVAVMIRSACSTDPSLTNSFEQLLFPPFQVVLGNDVVEFLPYVFQLLAQLLEYRSRAAGLGESYTSLFQPLLTPSLWASKGNVPALTRLMSAYLGSAAAELVSAGHLEGILGMFQNLISSRANEVNGFELLGSVILHVPHDSLQPYLMTLFQILHGRLIVGDSPRYRRLVTQFFALFVGKTGAQVFLDPQLNQIQLGLGLSLIRDVWLRRLQNDPPSRLDAKVHVVGLTRLLCFTPELLNDGNGRTVWQAALGRAIALLASPAPRGGMGRDDLDDNPVEIGYDATFSILHFAQRPAQDPFRDIEDPSRYFVQSLHSLVASNPGRLQPIIQEALQHDPMLPVALDRMFRQAGLNLW